MSCFSVPLKFVEGQQSQSMVIAVNNSENLALGHPTQSLRRVERNSRDSSNNTQENVNDSDMIRGLRNIDHTTGGVKREFARIIKSCRKAWTIVATDSTAASKGGYPPLTKIDKANSVIVSVSD
jgi:hypothetical protein